MRLHGRVLAVTRELAGDYLSVATVGGETTLFLEDASVFNELNGGTATIDPDGHDGGPEDLEYTAADYDLDTLTLVDPIAGVFETGVAVRVTPEFKTRYAYVQTDDADVPALTARVPYSIQAQLPLGQRSDVVGEDDTEYSPPEEVIVELVRGSWMIVDIIGSEGTITATADEDDTTPPPDIVSITVSSEVNAVMATWNDPLSADPDVADLDVAEYIVQVTDDPVADFTTPLKVWHKQSGSRVTYETNHYLRRYWFRIRTVDDAGNKGAWVTSGAVRPRKTMLASDTGGRVNEIDLTQGTFEYGGRLTNLARLISESDPGYAWADGENADGLLEGSVTVGPNDNQIYAGLTARRSGVGNFWAVALVDIASFEGVRLLRYDAGVPTTVASFATDVDPESTYELTVEMSGSSWSVMLDDVEVITATNATYSTATGYGIFARRGAGLDDGNARWDWLRFTPTGDVTSLDDDFDRATTITGGASGAEGGALATAPLGRMVLGWSGEATVLETTGLGTSPSGHVWLAVGDWGIEEVQQEFGMYGAALILPIFPMENTDQITRTIPNAAADVIPRLFGANGEDTDPLTFVIDRPTRFYGTAHSNVATEANSTFNVRFYIVYEVNGEYFVGRQQNVSTAANDESNHRQRYVGTSHDKVVQASRDAPVTVRCWWGYLNDDGTGRVIVIRNQKMTVIIGFAPDYSETYDPTKRSTWTKSGRTRAAYRQTEGNDN